MALITRAAAVRTRRTFFFSGTLLYGVIALFGMCASTIANQKIPTPPTDLTTWLFLFGEGIFVPISWLISYRIIREVGATNGVLISLFNTMLATFAGIVLVEKNWPAPEFLLGAILLIFASLVVFKISQQNGADDSRAIFANFKKAVGWILLGAVTYAAGIIFENAAVQNLAPKNYIFYGWTMQFLFALMIFAIFGRREIKKIRKKSVFYSIAMGFLTSISGILYIFALGFGEFSRTVVISSVKVVIVAFLAAIFLDERDKIGWRILALILGICGAFLVL